MKKLLMGIALTVVAGSAVAKNTSIKCDAHLVRINPEIPAPAATPVAAVMPAPLTPPASAMPTVLVAALKATEAPAGGATEPVPAAVSLEKEGETSSDAKVSVGSQMPSEPGATAPTQRKKRAKGATNKATDAAQFKPEPQPASFRTRATLRDYTFAEELP